MTSLRRLIESDVCDHLDKLHAISERASQEWAIEQAVADIAAHWGACRLLLEWHEQAACNGVAAAGLVAASEALQQHAARCQALLASQYAGSYEEQLQALLQRLHEQQVRGWGQAAWRAGRRCWVMRQGEPA